MGENLTVSGTPNPEQPDPTLIEQIPGQEVPMSADTVPPVEQDSTANTPPEIPPTEMQEDIVHDVDADTKTVDPVLDARLQGLRERGRVGVLTEEGVTKPEVDATRIRNSKLDPAAVAAINKANRSSRARDTEGKLLRPVQARSVYKRLDGQMAELQEKDRNELNLFKKDPDEWEKQRREAFPYLDEEGKDRQVENSRYVNQARINQFDKESRKSIEISNSRLNSDVAERSRQQDEFRGDLLQLFDRNPDKYKAMSTEEFIAEARKFKAESIEASHITKREEVATVIAEKLPILEKSRDLLLFTVNMNSFVKKLLNSDGVNKVDVIDFIASLKGRQIVEKFDAPDVDMTLSPEDQDKAYKTLSEARSAKRDAEVRLDSAIAANGRCFDSSDFVSDLDRTPREQMLEAVEGAKVLLEKWRESAQQARTQYESRWGQGSQVNQPE